MRKKLITSLSYPLILSVAHLLAKPAQAEELSIGVFPTLTEVTTYSGETIEAQVTIKNFQANPVTLTTLLQPFSASSEENGQVRYTEDAPEILKSVTVEDQGEPITEIVLSANQEKTLTVRLTIPESEASHDLYYSLVFLTKPATVTEELPQTGIHADSSLSAGVAAHFIVSVNPKTTKTVSVAEFSAPTFSPKTPVEFTVRAANQGTNYAKVRGEVEISNILGMRVDKVIIPSTTILSQSTRSLTNSISENSSTETSIVPKLAQNNHLFPGIYRAHLSLNKQDGSTPLSSTLYFAVAPVELLLTVFLLVGVGLLIRYRLKRKYVS